MRAAIILASSLALAACNMAADAEQGDAAPSGGGAQRSFAASGFDAVGLGGPDNVVVTVGPAASVRAEGDPEVLDRLRIRVRDGSLEIGRRKDDRWSSGRRRSATVYVTLPALRAAAIGGSGDMKIDKVSGSEFAASIGGSGDIDVGTLQVSKASFSIAGSGGIRAAGSADSADVSIVGSGDVDLARLSSRSASVSIAGSGGVRANASETADVSVMGSGDVEISGSARCTVNKMGSGNVRCGS